MTLRQFPCLALQLSSALVIGVRTQEGLRGGECAITLPGENAGEGANEVLATYEIRIRSQ